MPQIQKPSQQQQLQQQRPGALGGTAPASGERRRKLLSLGHTSRQALYKQHRDALAQKVANLPAPPPTYDPNLQYRISLKCAVEIPGHSEWLRPGHDNIVSGEFANSIADSISGAEVVS